MSTQFDSPILDLDRTDQLPVLNVVAYDKDLSRTDTWTVEGLRASGDSDEESTARAGVQAEALTVNVERILKRIAELEAEVVAAQETNASLQRDCEALRAEQVQKGHQIATLQSDNTRLNELRLHSDEVAHNSEQQLSKRIESMATLEKSLSSEKDVTAQLSRQLAVKLMDYEQAIATIELRDRAIKDINRSAAELNERLRQETTVSADLTARLAAAEESLKKGEARLREQLDARTADLAQRNSELAQLHGELVAARAEAQCRIGLLKERTDELGSVRRKLNEHETAIQGFEQTMRLNNEQTKDLMTQLLASRDERSALDEQLNNARVRTKTLTDQIFSRDNRITELEADLAVHAEALATIQRDVNRIGHRADAAGNEVEHLLEPVGHDGPALHLNGEVLTIGRTTDNDICIPSKLISRFHARLLVGPTGVIIEDVNSLNGCYVNGEHVKQYLLQNGDVLALGDTRYRLRTRAVRDKGMADAKVRQLSSAPRPQRRK